MKFECRGCEFCFSNNENGFVCADKYYGQDITDSVNVVKECYSLGFNDFCKLRENMKNKRI